MNRLRSALYACLACMLVTSPAWAAPDRELLELRNTVVNLVDALVEQGVLTADQADTLKTKAREKAEADANAEVARAEAAEAAAERLTGGKEVTRVNYIPEFIKDDIRMQVRAELREEVTEDVIAIAKQEEWGVAGALPEWVRNMRVWGNFRLREQSDLRLATSALVPDFAAINQAGGIQRAGNEAFLNTTEDFHRLRARMRVNVALQPLEKLEIRTRLITGVVEDPRSANLDFGRNGNNNFDFVMDRAYMEWTETNDDGHTWLTLTGGRMPIPFLHTFMLWDPDMNLDGLRATARWNFGGDSNFDLDSARSSVYLTAAGFVINTDESPVDDGQSNDTYLLAAQLGFEHEFADTSRVEVAAALYDYVNIAGVRNRTLNSTLKDFTAATFVQVGNSMFDIRNDLDPTTNLFGRAADFTMLNLTGRFEYGGFDPVRIGMTADVVSNIAYDEQEILERTGVRIPERNLGYSLMFDAGHDFFNSDGIYTAGRGAWFVDGGYKYIQRDAVMDAFNDSNFRGGGTNGKGWVVQAMYGLTTKTWVRARYFTTDEIDGQPFAVDIVQLDLNAQF